jgi:hypothetical protein
MGRTLLGCRLAAKDLRRRHGEAAMLLAIITATTTLTLGLTLHGVTSQPYLATRAATAGPDLVANVFPSRPGGGPPADLLALARAPGVTGHGGPYPVTLPVLRARGHTDGVIAIGRDQAPAPSTSRR